MGNWDVDGMLEKIPSHLFHEWMAFDTIDPFGEWRKDFRAGIVASTIVNMNRDPSKSRPSHPSDFIPKFGLKKKKKPTTKDITNKVLALAKAFGAKIIKRNES